MSQGRRILATSRTQAIARHMMTSTTAHSEVCLTHLSGLYHRQQSHQEPVMFESNLALRTYVLNRPQKLNALDEPMLGMLRPKIEVSLVK